MLGAIFEEGLDKIRRMSPQHPEDIEVHFGKSTQGMVACRLSMHLLGKTVVASASGRRRLIAFHAAQRKLANIIKKRKDALIGAKRKRVPTMETLQTEPLLAATLKQEEQYND